MSQTETHIGKLRKVQTELSVEEWCKARLNANGVTEMPSYNKTWKETLIDHENDNIFFIDDEVWEAVERKELEEGEDINHFQLNDDGTISFVTQFYNGATYLAECIEDGLKSIKK